MNNINWKKINRPKTWRPKKEGEELIGFYVGRTLKTGQFGQYEVLTVVAPDRGAFMISGTQLIQLADVALLQYGTAVRVRFMGRKPIGEDREMKEFELYVSEAELTAEDVMQVKRAVEEAMQ